jgi:uncharacterized membrane protein YqjE
MAEMKEKPRAQRESQITKELFYMLSVSIVFFLLWGWLTSIDAVAWLQPALLALAVISGIWCLVHAVLKELFRHGFHQ